jgi:hypothetical protein
MKDLFKALLFCGMLHTTATVHAQLPTVDITSIVLPTNEVEVRIRPDATFNGVFSSIVFTLRWDVGESLSLGDVLQDIPQLQYCTITKSGTEQVSGPSRYQIFVGFGSIPLTSLSTFWQADQEVVLCRIPIVGTAGPISLMEDNWTTSNNGDFYTSLNGEDRTGLIYSITTGLGLEGPLSSGLGVFPNPTQGSVFVTLAEYEQGPTRYELVDGTGRIIPIPSTPKGANTETQVLDLSGIPNGVYQLVVITEAGNRTERIIVQK